MISRFFALLRRLGIRKDRVHGGGIVPKCPEYPRYDNCSECEAYHQPCHPSHHKKKTKPPEDVKLK